MTTAATTARRPGRTRAQRAHAIQGWLYASPTALFVGVLFVVPLVLVVAMSLGDWPLLAGFRGWNFPDNYIAAVDHRLFWEAIRFTVIYTIAATVLLIGLGLGLALLVQESSRWRSFLRTAFLVPSALGLASASLLFYVLYSPIAGPFAEWMESSGFTILGTPGGALWATVFLIVWRFTGFYMLLMLVGLQAIPGEVYEAARIDGASKLQTFLHVTMPLMRPTFALTIVMCVTGSLLAFEQFYILTKGGPDNSTMTVVQLMYSMAFQGQNDLGIAGALSVIVLIALVVINVFQLRVLRGGEES
ncbi:sugar ABC transporter permease [Microbacterium sp. JZ37]|uniref:carbohydrate ABC transporter permease n=1 Tax=Microbacterium sp. JZ37 TaxID=2654193 RepID=UPI002B463CFA|nr:sugar ABC transporter permease [Microbacterium sp. JZ37]WRH16408.1 ABC transporter permease subunit [Microbacterium sp. JZ37]